VDFVDYTARYGALRDGDDTTLRGVLGDGPSNSALAQRLGFVGKLLDTPAIALSNGQTRRARILRALLARPHVLLLDEPLSTRPPLPFLHNV
jgi:ATPase subunit of ABC transporter with duplicated ATPase domains